MDFNKIIIRDVSSLATVSLPKGKAKKMKDRAFFGLSFTLDGQITYVHKGRSFVSDRGHATILPKGESYDIHPQKEGAFALINFECEDFEPDTITLLPVKNPEAIMKEFEYMKNMFIREENRFMVMSSLYKILYQLTQAGNLTLSPLSSALKYLEENYTSDITNATLAKECRISEEYFRKQFKRIYGLSPKQYVINMRINKAKQLLSGGTLKINAISEQCGFSNPYHFCRIFKQKTGLTPSEFMAQNKLYNM
ncbi:MAG: helix-turn-helix transcriptional regulator [Clostridia bacterium]|nr:helix-turn-helix transcriptional regulator [Clostridia bacterium]